MHSNSGDLILEPFCGSGTTILAALQCDRICFAIEKEPLYVDLAVRRYANFVKDAQISLLRNGEILSVEETGLVL
jgi:DNA modification methylase